MKKIIILGSGVAGLTAGICGQKSGFETIIFEKNPWIGGSCSAWKRDGYVIDNCLHWLTGTKEGSPDTEMWKELGVLKDDEPLEKRPYFFACRAAGKTVTLWRDINRTRKEMLEISPEDADEINAFLDFAQFFGDLLSSGQSAKEIYRSIKDFNSSLNDHRFEFTKYFVKYLNLNSSELAAQFKHPAIQNIFTDFMAKEYESYWLMLAYGFFIAGNGDLPKGGSWGMSRNLKEKYISLGGKILTNMTAKQILIDPHKRTIKNVEEALLNGKSPRNVIYRHATGVLFEDNHIEYADYIIPACDIYFTYKYLLNNRYTPASLKKLYRRPEHRKSEIYSSFQIAYSVDGLFECVPDTLSIGCNMITVATQTYERISIKNYHPYGDYIAPEGKTVIQVTIPQYEKDFKYWKHLYQTPDLYKTEKQQIAEAVQEEIEQLFPEYKGKLHILDVWTPYSYKRLNNDYLGAYMRYITTPFSFNAFLPQEIFGIDNVVLASHCLRYPGGLPTAAYTGRDAIEIIKKWENPINPVEKIVELGKRAARKASREQKKMIAKLSRKLKGRRSAVLCSGNSY